MSDTWSRLVIAGQGVVVVPREPFEIGRLDSGDLVVVHHAGEVSPKLRLSTSGETVQLGLGPGTSRWEDVLHMLEEDPSSRGVPYELDLDGATAIEWPMHMTAWSTESSWPIELTFDDESLDEMLYVQGALESSRIPAMASLVAPGQTLTRTDTFAGMHGVIECIELAYEHQGVAWVQWRARVPRNDGFVGLVTAQAPSVRRDRMRAALEQVARSLVPAQSTE